MSVTRFYRGPRCVRVKNNARLPYLIVRARAYVRDGERWVIAKKKGNWRERVARLTLAAARGFLIGCVCVAELIKFYFCFVRMM